MRNPSQRHGDIALHTSESFGKIGRQQQSAVVRRLEISNKSPRRNEAVPPRQEVEAYARHALAANGFGDVAVEPTEPLRRLSSVELYRCARAYRSQQLAQIVVATGRALVARARRMYAEWQRSRQARTTYVALRKLDTRTLRDLGFDRSEILSVTAEIVGDADSTRVRSGQAVHGLPF